MFKKIKAVLDVIRIKEMPLTVPFGATAAFLASGGFPDIPKLLYLVIAIAAGFSAGNILNAWADKDIDAKNPRTADRPLAKKALSGKMLLLLVALCGITVLVCTALIEPFYVLLLPIPIAICVIYCFCKRFTFLGDFLIGVAHAIAPVAGWVVFSGWTDMRAVLMGAVVTFFTISLAMIYSMQDLEYDKKMGLHSFPVHFGVKASYAVSGIAHVVTVALSVWLALVTPCGIPFIAGLVISELLLILQYVLIIINQKNARFAFNINQGVSLVLCASAFIDKLI